MCDAARAQVLYTVTIHAAGVHCFAHSHAFGVVASGGLERTLRLWQAQASSYHVYSCSGAAVHTDWVPSLAGKQSPGCWGADWTQRVCAACRHGRLSDHQPCRRPCNQSVGVRPAEAFMYWQTQSRCCGPACSASAQDLRSSRCLQAIDAAEQCAPEDARPGVLLYDSTHRQLISAAHRPLAWAPSSASAALSRPMQNLL